MARRFSFRGGASYAATVPMGSNIVFDDINRLRSCRGAACPEESRYPGRSSLPN